MVLNLYTKFHYSGFNMCQDIGRNKKTTNMTSLTFKSRSRSVIYEARAAFATGPNVIPYKVYKCCPRLAQRLWKLLKVVWHKGELPEAWKLEEGRFIPKEENEKSLSQFQMISLLNVEVKIFMTILAKSTTYFPL